MLPLSRINGGFKETSHFLPIKVRFLRCPKRVPETPQNKPFKGTPKWHQIGPKMTPKIDHPRDLKGPQKTPRPGTNDPRTNAQDLKPKPAKPSLFPLTIEGDLQGREGQAECAKRQQLLLSCRLKTAYGLTAPTSLAHNGAAAAFL